MLGAKGQACWICLKIPVATDHSSARPVGPTKWGLTLGCLLHRLSSSISLNETICINMFSMCVGRIISFSFVYSFNFWVEVPVIYKKQKTAKTHNLQ
jgi:hypothetical protein